MKNDLINTVSDALVGTFGCLDRTFDLPPTSLAYRPPRDDAWTIADHLEHVYLVNRFLLIIIRKGVTKAVKKAVSSPSPPDLTTDFSILDPIAVPDAFSWPAPAHMLPAGVADLHELREVLRRQRDETLVLLRSMEKGEGALHRIRMSVNNLGKIDMYQWLYFLAQHGRYHLRYIDRLRHEAVSRRHPSLHDRDKCEVQPSSGANIPLDSTPGKR